ncbi:hypothetical protein K502DRAFT_342532 [Neoconidiobolus thromboides FSU 785]|nr:hypothetical protein K502DRAFT_342532 [Neoconidiobolus thromboides FSU 785]
MEEIKPVEKYNLLDLKVAADEEVARYYTSKGWVENHMFVDMKLIFGYLGAIIALADFLLTYKKEFKTVRYVSLFSSSSYFIISGFMFLWTYFMQGKTVYLGKKPGKEGEYAFKSHHKVDAGGQPLYEVSFVYEFPDSLPEQPKFKKVTETWNFATFFDDQGKLSQSHFHAKLDGLLNQLDREDKNE